MFVRSQLDIWTPKRPLFRTIMMVIIIIEIMLKTHTMVVK